MTLEKKLEITSIQQKLLSVMKQSGWEKPLRTFLHSKDFEIMIEKIVDMKEHNIRFVPSLNLLFKCFKECPYEQLKMVIASPIPFEKLTPGGLPVADGLALSHRPMEGDQVKHANLHLRTAAMGKCIDPGKTDLRPWANQGVLLLNTSLTTTLGFKKGHPDIYHDFMNFLFETLDLDDKQYVFMFINGTEQYYDTISDPKHFKIMSNLPAPGWNGQELFFHINRNLTAFNNPINWTL